MTSESSPSSTSERKECALLSMCVAFRATACYSSCASTSSTGVSFDSVLNSHITMPGKCLQLLRNGIFMSSLWKEDAYLS